jgi:1,5-rhamnosyltransferase
MDSLFVVFRKQSDYAGVETDELQNYCNVLFDKKINNRILSMLNRLHTAIRTNRHFRIPLQKIWFRYYLDRERIKKSEEVYFLFTEGTRMGYSPEYLTYIHKEYPNAKLVFAFTNPTKKINSKYIGLIKKHYDLILSFDLADCEEYGWIFYSGVYSKRDDLDLSGIKESDVFFVGTNKGRIDAVHEIFDLLTGHGLKCDFHVMDVENSKIRDDNPIHYNKRLSYEEVLKRVCMTKCILEIPQLNQTGSSLRVMEAIVYGKKLLTCNKAIKQERFYNKNQMLVFDKPSDINIEFLNTNVEQFEYDGSLSPYKRLEFIQNYFRNGGTKE